MKRKLVKCAARAYSELIRSDIPGSSGARPAQLPFLRSSPLSVMKRSIPKSSSPSVSEPLTAKPTRGELRSCLEVLAKKKMSMKRKPPSLTRGLPPYSGKDPKGGGLSLTFVRCRSWRLFGGEGDEPPLEVLLIGLESHVTGRRSPSYNARLGDGES